MRKTIGVYADESSVVCLDGARIHGFDIAVDATDSTILMRGGNISYNHKGIILRRSKKGSEVKRVNIERNLLYKQSLLSQAVLTALYCQSY